MIGLPLTPSFFKRIGIYQDLTDDELTIDKKLWKYEKALLIWTVKNHQHLASSISIDDVRDKLRELGFTSSTVNDLAPKVMGNLCKRGYTVAIDIKTVEDEDYEGAGRIYEEVRFVNTIAVESPARIVFTQEGLLAGKILSEIEKNLWGRYKYKVFIGLIWVTLVVIVVETVGIKLWNWVSSVDINGYIEFFKNCTLL